MLTCEITKCLGGWVAVVLDGRELVREVRRDPRAAAAALHSSARQMVEPERWTELHYAIEAAEDHAVAVAAGVRHGR